jgi:serine/threonine-protein kinase
MDAVSPDLDGADAESEGPDPLLGARLAGKYELLEVLGEGAMGRIYRARQADLDRMIAIKVLHKHLGGEDRVARRFHREARAASRLSHPNSVQILDYGSENGILYIAMELLEGEDLQAVLDHDPPPSPARIATILVPVLRAVDEAHRAGIVHRDLKPENVILWADRSGREHVKVCDFGIAKILDGEGNSITVDGFVCGTPQYMAPEQARGDVIDHRVDVYAAGVVLYQMLCGKVPFSGETALGIITKHLTDDPVPPSQRNPDRFVPTVLESVAMKAMSKAAVDRYQTAGEMADALTAAVATLGEDGTRSVSDAAMKKHAPAYTRRDLTGPQKRMKQGKSGRTIDDASLVDTEAATREMAATQAPSSRWLTAGLVVMACVVLALTAALLMQQSNPLPVGAPEDPPPLESDPPVAPAPEVEVVSPIEIPTEVAPEPEVTAPPPEVRGPGAPRVRTDTTPSETPAPIEAVETPPETEPTPAISPGAAAFAEGRRLFLANDMTGAIQRFQEASRLMPTNPEVQRQLGRAHMRAGDVAHSVAAYRRYLELAPEAPDRTVVEGIISRNTP